MVRLLQGKTIFVTGASSGIGRAIAIGAAHPGANVVINYLRDTAGAGSRLAAIKARGQRRLVVQGNGARPETATDLVAKSQGASGRVDVMVSNAGICPVRSFLDMPKDDAVAAAGIGADGIVVSTARALPPIARALGDRLRILADGGIRSGLGVARMLAFGAKGVLLGRAWVDALAGGQKGGVAHMLALVAAEMRVAMAVTGATSIGRIGGDIPVGNDSRPGDGR